MKNKIFLKNAFIISLGGFISKLIGAVYRIPLIRLIGCRGIGLYQLVYPFYCVLLTVSACGIPSAIAKMVADKESLGGRGVVKVSFRLFAAIGIFCSLLLFLSAETVSLMQGEKALASAYRAIAPAVFLVSVISVYRGWFQGKNDMFPTAVSEVAEQLVKVFFSIFFALIFRKDVYRAVTAILFSVTVSEGVAFLYLLLCYKKIRFFLPLYQKKYSEGEILRTSLPVTLSSSVLPFSMMLDSVFIVRLLSRFTSEAVAEYGIFSGGAITFVSLPASLCYGLAAAVIPKIAGANGSAEKRKSVFFSLFVTVAIAVPCAIGLWLFSGFAAKIFFGSLSAYEHELLISLVKIMSISAIFLPCVQTLSACLTAKGKAGLAALSMGIGAGVKILTILFFLNEKNGIYAAAHAVNICYFIVFVINFLLNITDRKVKHDNDRRSRLRKG